MKRCICTSLLLLAVAAQAQVSSVYNVMDYGAKGDCLTDDSAAIQSAINACGQGKGGIVYFPANTGSCYLSSSTLNVGNGSSSGWSTDAACSLVGGAPDTGISIGSPLGAVVLKYTASGGDAVRFDGPMAAGGMENLYILCSNDTWNRGVELDSVSFGVFRNLSFDYCSQPIFNTTWGNHASESNKFENIWMYLPPGGSSVYGIQEEGGAGGDVFLDEYDNVLIIPSAPAHTCLILGYTDSDKFKNFTCNPYSGAGAIIFDYANGISAGFPSNIQFDGLETYGDLIVNSGTPLLSSPNTAWNRIRGFSRGNGAPYPYLPNLIIDDRMADSWMHISAGSPSPPAEIFCIDCKVSNAAACSPNTPAGCACTGGGFGAYARYMNYQGGGNNWYCQ